MKKFFSLFSLFVAIISFSSFHKATAQVIVEAVPVQTYWGVDQFGHQVRLVNRYYIDYCYRHGIAVGYGVQSYGGYYDSQTNTVSMQPYGGYSPQYGYGYGSNGVVIIITSNTRGYYGGPMYRGQGGGYINRQQNYGNSWQNNSRTDDHRYYRR